MVFFRALSIVASDEWVKRDQFYNGNVSFEPTAIVMRAAPSWFRFGSFEILHYRKDFELLKVNGFIISFSPTS